MSPTDPIICRLCGQAHIRPELRRGYRAQCVRCAAVIAKAPRFGPETAAALALAGCVLAVPAAALPFASAGKLGGHRTIWFLTEITATWGRHRPELATLALLCGALIPAALLVLVAIVLVPRLIGAAWEPSPRFASVIRNLSHWAMPEVQVLAVLVALAKLGSFVDFSLGPGFWCYCAMSFALLFSVHSGYVDLEDPELVRPAKP